MPTDLVRFARGGRARHLRLGAAAASVGRALLLTAALLGGASASAAPLHVVATVPDLGELVRAVGGKDVRVTVLVKGPQDPHFVEPRPSLIRALHGADLFVKVGMELERAWAPALLRAARNPRIAVGAAGHVDASHAVVPLEVPTGPVDRSQGDVHPYGNPHYLTDPVNGARVAALVRDVLAGERPDRAELFAARYRRFAGELATRLAGPAAVARLGAGRVLEAAHAGTLTRDLASTDPPAPLGGWLGRMQPWSGTPAVEEHKLFAYFAHRFGLRLIATLEPRPGIAPTTRHLASVIGRMAREHAPVILSVPYFDDRHARWVAERTGAKVVPMAHQTGARPQATDYLATVEYNVSALAEAIDAWHRTHAAAPGHAPADSRP